MPDYKLGSKEAHEKAMKQAELMYYRYKPLREIAEATGLPFGTIVNRVKEWRPKREQVTDQVVENMREQSRNEVSEILEIGLPMLKASLVSMSKRVDKKTKEWKPLSIYEARCLTEIITSVDKLMRLDSGLPTDINTIRPASIEDIKKALKADKFIPEEAKKNIMETKELPKPDMSEVEDVEDPLDPEKYEVVEVD